MAKINKNRLKIHWFFAVNPLWALWALSIGSSTLCHVLSFLYTHETSRVFASLMCTYICMYVYVCAPKSPFRLKNSQLLSAAKCFVDDFTGKSAIATIKSCLTANVSCHKWRCLKQQRAYAHTITHTHIHQHRCKVTLCHGTSYLKRLTDAVAVAVTDDDARDVLMSAQPYRCSNNNSNNNKDSYQRPAIVVISG